MRTNRNPDALAFGCKRYSLVLVKSLRLRNFVWRMRHPDGHTTRMKAVELLEFNQKRLKLGRNRKNDGLCLYSSYATVYYIILYTEEFDTIISYSFINYSPRAGKYTVHKLFLGQCVKRAKTKCNFEYVFCKFGKHKSILMA